MMLAQKRIEVLIADEVLLLDDLSIDIGRTECLDLCYEEVSDPLNGLQYSVHLSLKNRTVKTYRSYELL